MLFPKGVGDGEHGAPEHFVVFAWLVACAGYPLKIGVYVSILSETLPVGFVVGSDGGGVELGAEPCTVLMVDVGLDALGPVVEGEEVALGIDHEGCHVLAWVWTRKAEKTSVDVVNWRLKAVRWGVEGGVPWSTALVKMAWVSLRTSLCTRVSRSHVSL